MKKIITIVCCVVAACFVLGLSPRMTYPDFKTSIERVQGSADIISDDMEMLHMISYVFENFNIDDRLVIIKPYQNIISLKIVSGVTENIISEASFVFSSNAMAQRAENILAPLFWEYLSGLSGVGGVGFWDNVIDAVGTVVYVLGAILTVIVFVVQFALDSVLTAWELVRFLLYVIGL